MKKYLLLLFFCSLSFVGQAQVDDGLALKRFLLELGPSIPLQGFSDNLVDGGGFAKTGINVSTGLLIPINKNFRVGAIYQLASNPIDNEGLESLNVFVPGVTLSSGAWRSHSILAAVQFQKELGNDFQFTASPLAGLVMANSPELEVSLGPLSANIDTETGMGFVYGGQVGVRKGLVGRHGVRFTARYLTAKPEPFNLRTPAVTIGTFTIPSQGFEIDTRFTLMTLNLGWDYHF
jgi:hypothetical protein